MMVKAIVRDNIIMPSAFNFLQDYQHHFYFLPSLGERSTVLVYVNGLV